MVKVELQTRSFTFEAYGKDENEATAALLLGWANHCEQTGADVAYIDECDLSYLQVTAGKCYRDGQPEPIG